jgi:hypothetical protein
MVDPGNFENDRHVVSQQAVEDFLFVKTKLRV